jgi:hypothetical protein
MRLTLFILMMFAGITQCTSNVFAAEKRIKRPHKTEVVATTETGARISCKIEATELQELLDLNNQTVKALLTVGGGASVVDDED